MFAHALSALVQQTGGDLAVFCDYEGESIAHASRRGFDDYEAKVTGAQVAALLFELQKLARNSSQTERVAISCRADGCTLLLEGLPNQYYLVLRLPPNALEALARYRLHQVAEAFLEQL